MKTRIDKTRFETQIIDFMNTRNDIRKNDVFDYITKIRDNDNDAKYKSFINKMFNAHYFQYRTKKLNNEFYVFINTRTQIEYIVEITKFDVNENVDYYIEYVFAYTHLIYAFDFDFTN